MDGQPRLAGDLGKALRRHDIAAIWAAFFSRRRRCQQDHFWLNEGCARPTACPTLVLATVVPPCERLSVECALSVVAGTRFVETKIMERHEGKPIAHLKVNEGLKALRDAVEEFGPTHNFTKLVPGLDGSDPGPRRPCPAAYTLPSLRRCIVWHSVASG